MPDLHGIALTDEQHAAATSDAHEIILSAGAGTGKTTTLVARHLYLTRDLGVPTSAILTITFTRKAAGEMLRRLASMIDEREIRFLTVGTFHSVALKILRQHAERLGYDGARLTVIDEADRKMLILQCAEELGFYSGTTKKWRNGLSLEQSQHAIDRLQQEYVHVICDDVDMYKRQLFAHYQAALRQLHALDFGTILMECLALLSEHADVRQQYNEKLKHVIVDEVQDTSEAEWRWIRMFAPPAAFFACGDIRQALYRFKGARPDLFGELLTNAVV